MATVIITCERCGKQKEVLYRGVIYKQRFCSTNCAHWRHGNSYAVGPVRGGKLKHVLIAENALGHALPRGAVVHHHDQNKRNNSNQNLVICENEAYHRLLHARTRIVWAGGDPDRQKFCTACRAMKDFTEFCQNRTKRDGLSDTCRTCHHAYKKIYANRNRKKHSIT